MNILALDTSTNACSVALQSGSEIWVEHRVCPRQQSDRILPQIDTLFQQADIQLADIELIACGVGPGAFMGCRLAVSVVQGLAFATGIPVVPFSTLQILAQTTHLEHKSTAVIAAWDARMGQMYSGAYRLNQQGVMVEEIADYLIDPAAFSLPEQASWVASGNAWEVYQSLLSPDVMASLDDCYPSLYPEARALIQLAEAVSSEQYLQAADLKPVYLRSPIKGK